MFEYKGNQYTLADLQTSAKKQGYENFDEFLQAYKDAGLKEVSAPTTMGSDTLGAPLAGGSMGQQEVDDGFDDDMSIAQGVENWAKNFIPNRKANLFQIKESIGGYINLMGGPDAAAWFLGEDVDSKGQAVMIDPDSGLKVGFDNNAYDRDGHDAFENRR